MLFVILSKDIHIGSNRVLRNPTAPGAKLARLYVPKTKDQTAQYDDKNFLYDAELSRASGHTKKKWEAQVNMNKVTSGGSFKHPKTKKLKLGKKGKPFMSEAHPSAWTATDNG